MNQIVIVGKVKELPALKETANGNKIASILIEVERSFKNAQGEIEKDDFMITLWRGVAEECQSNCQIGTIIGVKGRLQANNFTKDDVVYYKPELIAEKVSVLSTN